MKKEIMHAIVGSFVTIVITLVITWLGGPKASIELSSVQTNDGKYYNTVLIKNMQNSEYLKNIEFIVDSNINVTSILINGNLLDNSNKIIIKKLNPKDVNIISFTTNIKMTKDNLKLIKNGQRIDYAFFNDRRNINVYIILIIAIYAIINFAISLFADSRQKKENKLLYEKLEKTENTEKEVSEKMAMVEKKLTAENLVYLKELNDMERESSFYQHLLLKNLDGKISKDELEKMVIKELKIFSKKKTKYLSYNDAIKIVEKIIESDFFMSTHDDSKQ